jgi:hypothetical protein
MFRLLVIALLVLSPVVATGADPVIEVQASVTPEAEVDIRQIPFALPSAVTGSIEQFASQCDVLTLGEVHGTQEVPLLTLALLAPLTKLGYKVLALEIPKDQEAPLIAWASGQTETVPEFFSKPSSDGKGNAQQLSLIRIALSPPFRWKLICFDSSMSDFQTELEELKRKSDEGKNQPQASPFALSDEVLAFWKKRDAAMATNLRNQLKALTPRPKVLAICGGLHNRTENNAEFPELKPLWPTFAAVLKRDNSSWKIGSVNIKFHSGGFFNGGKVNKFHGRKIDEAEARPAIETGYDWELNLPHANPATFLSPPVDPQ